MRRAAALSLVVPGLLAVSIAGCGGTDNSKDFSGSKKAVAEAIDDISSNARKLEAGKICDSFLTAQLKATITAQARKQDRSDCADQLKESLRDIDVFDMDIQSIDVTGTNATARVRLKTTADPDPTATLRLVNQRGWRLSQLPY